VCSGKDICLAADVSRRINPSRCRGSYAKMWSGPLMGTDNYDGQAQLLGNAHAGATRDIVGTLV